MKTRLAPVLGAASNRTSAPFSWIVFGLSLAVAAVVFAADDSAPAEPDPGTAASRVASTWRLVFELTAGYDDNITELSETDRARLEDPACLSDPHCSSRFRIESAGDWFIAPEARLEWSRTSHGGLESSFRGQARANIYSVDSIKDYQAYELWFSQELSAGSHPTALIASVGYIPDYYLRELSVPEASRIAGTTVRDSARFASTEFSLRIAQVLVPRYLELEATVATEPRDYQAPFDERDGDLTGWSAVFNIEPAGSGRFTVRVGYRSQSYGAAGDNPATQALEPDISNRREALLGGLTVRWGKPPKRGWLTVSGSWERRDFTTGEQLDIYHYGREDKRTRYALIVRQALGKRLYLEGRAVHEVNDSSLGPLVVSTGDDVTDFTQNVYSLTAGLRF